MATNDTNRLRARIFLYAQHTPHAAIRITTRSSIIEPPVSSTNAVAPAVFGSDGCVVVVVGSVVVVVVVVVVVDVVVVTVVVLLEITRKP